MTFPQKSQLPTNTAPTHKPRKLPSSARSLLDDGNLTTWVRSAVALRRKNGGSNGDSDLKPSHPLKPWTEDGIWRGIRNLLGETSASKSTVLLIRTHLRLKHRCYWSWNKGSELSFALWPRWSTMVHPPERPLRHRSKARAVCPVVPVWPLVVRCLSVARLGGRLRGRGLSASLKA